MHQDTPEEKDSRAGKLRFPLVGRKRQLTEQKIWVRSLEIKGRDTKQNKKGASAYQRQAFFG